MPDGGASGADGLASGFAQIPGGRIIAARAIAIHWVDAPGSIAFVPPGDFLDVALEPIQGLMVDPGNGSRTSLDVPLGTVQFSPVGTLHSATWSGPRQSLAVGLPHARFKALVGDTAYSRLPRLIPPHAQRDQSVARLAHLIRANIAGGGVPDHRLIDDLVAALGSALLRGLALPASAGGAGSGRFGPATRRELEQFIFDNYSMRITVSELATLAGLSRGHFIASFRRTFGLPPHQYILNFRLDCAQKLLERTALPLTEVAATTGFNSQSHMTSAFRRFRGATPRQIRLKFE